MTDLVSILIPARNAERWIAETIASALTQTWSRTEIIIVDDGSTDATLACARQFDSKTVKVVTQSNQGAAAARNTAFSLCQGDYIQWLDADDLLSPDKITKQMEARDRGRRTLLSCAWAAFMYRPHRARFRATALWRDLTPAEWLIRKLALHLQMQTATWLVSRELSDAAGPWDTRLVVDDDGEYFCRVLLASDRVRFVPEGRVYYRVTDGNRLSHVGRSTRKIEAEWLSVQLHIGYLRSLDDSQRVRAACVTYLQNYLIDFYPDRPDIVQKAEALATELGGRLQMPTLSWKYDWIRRLCGWDAGKSIEEYLRWLKWSSLRRWDKAVRKFEALLTRT